MQSQKGATLIVGLIMLVLITVLVISAFNISSSNIKSVGNMQYRDEAIAAASDAIETVIGSDFVAVSESSQIDVDINRDNAVDYVVQVNAPTCIQVTPAPGSEDATASGEESNVQNASNMNTMWEIQAQVTDAATGVSVTVVQGLRKKLSQTQYITSSCI